MATHLRIKQTITALLIAVLLGLAAFSPAVAQNYNCGTYGGGDYNENCASASGGSSPGSSGASFDTVEESEKIVLNDFEEYFTTTGKDLALALGQVIYFTVEVNGVIEEHTATVKEIGADYVILTFGPLVSELRIDVGDTINADVTGDGQPDIQIKLTSITDGLANLTFRKYVVDALPIPDKTATAETPNETAQGTSFWKIAGLGFSVLLVLVGSFWGFATRRRRRSNNDIIHP